MRLTRAIVRLPGPNFADGLTTANLGTPDIQLALEQHARYGDALRECGLDLTVLPSDPLYPDGVFVEDTAIVTPRGALITRPGAPSRVGEVDRIRDELRREFPRLTTVGGDGTIDGGDVCEADGSYLIGVGGRTNADGARQASEWLTSLGYTSRLIDLRGIPGLLHLKSGLTYLGEGHLVVVDALAQEPALRDFDQIIPASGEEYAANCLRINDRVLVARGFPDFDRRLRGLGCTTIEIDVSEYRKMDGGLSCLSLRY
jgi:dimethylargininase